MRNSNHKSGRVHLSLRFTKLFSEDKQQIQNWHECYLCRPGAEHSVRQEPQSYYSSYTINTPLKMLLRGSLTSIDDLIITPRGRKFVQALSIVNMSYPPFPLDGLRHRIMGYISSTCFASQMEGAPQGSFKKGRLAPWSSYKKALPPTHPRKRYSSLNTGETPPNYRCTTVVK